MRLAVLAATLALAGAAQAAEGPAFKLIWSDETYGDLKSASILTGLDPLRYVPVGDGYLSFGGEARPRVDMVDASRSVSTARRPTALVWSAALRAPTCT